MNAFVIMKKNDPDFAGNRDDERVFFLKSLSRSLIVPQAKSRLEIIQTPRMTKIIIQSCAIKIEEKAIEKQKTQTRGRCHLCPRAKDRKVKTFCAKCQNLACEDHSNALCIDCNDD